MERQNSIYSTRQALTLGFHGTDEDIVEDVVRHFRELNASNNPWDWIGHGVYFWEHSHSRAIEYAQSASRRRKSNVRKPAVIGAILDLGYCLDLLDYGNSRLLKEAYQYLQLRSLGGGYGLKNSPVSSTDEDLKMRFLDCAVIEAVHDLNREQHQPPFDSVRGVFWEGPPLYATAGFREKSHIQICIRNPNCIKGLFIPRLHIPFKE